MSFISWLKQEAAAAQKFLVGLFGQNAVDNFEQRVKLVFQQDVLKIITDAVQAAASNSQLTTGAQKRDAAFSAIKSDLSAIGKTLQDNMVNFGIEYVVGLLKAKAA